MRADDNYKILQPTLVIQKLLETLYTTRKTVDNEIILKICIEVPICLGQALKH